MQRTSDLCKVFHEVPIVITETNEWSHLFNVFGFWPFSDSSNFLKVSSSANFIDNMTEVNNLLGFSFNFAAVNSLNIT